MNYKLTTAEYDTYSKFKPSFLQRCFWIVWPTLDYIKWQRVQNSKREDCIDYNSESFSKKDNGSTK